MLTRNKLVFYRVKETKKKLILLLSDMDTSTFEVIKKKVEEYLKRNDEDFTIECPSVYRSLLPDLHATCRAKFVALGLGTFYMLRFSKLEKVPLSYFELCPKVKQTFIQMTGLKIPENLTWQTIALLDPYNGVKEWIDILLDAIRYVGGEKQFIDKHYSISDKVRALLQSRNEKFEQWTSTVVQPLQMRYIPRATIDGTTRKSITNLYHKLNNEQHFISIDIKAANFQVLKQYGLILENDWVELVSKFSPHIYFTKIKNLRMKTLSHEDFDPKKQQVVWQNMTITILNYLIEDAKVLDANDFAAFNSDELVFRSSDQTQKQKVIDALINSPLKEWCSFVKVDGFTLFAIPQTKYYVKKMDDNKIEIKCANGEQIVDAISKVDYLMTK